MVSQRDEVVELSPGTRIGAFRVIKVLKYGRGGMAQVCLAKDAAGATVALKVALHARFNDTIQREAELLAELDHPNIVRIIPINPQKGHYHAEATKLPLRPRYFAMEYLAGDSLDTYLAARGPLAVPEAVEFVVQLAGALQYCHGRRDRADRPAPVTHLDIKPDNAIFRLRCTSIMKPVPDLVLLDFGISKRQGQKAIPAGALPYMAPEWIRAIKSEQFMAMDCIDGRADAYSLGAVFYQMLAARPPFLSSEVTSTEILKKAPEPPSHYVRALHKFPDVERLIMSLLSKAPEDRPSLSEVVLELNNAIPPADRLAWFRARALRSTLARVGKVVVLLAIVLMVLCLARSMLQGSAVGGLVSTATPSGTTTPRNPFATTSVPSRTGPPAPTQSVWPTRAPTATWAPTPTNVPTPTPAPTPTSTPTLSGSVAAGGTPSPAPTPPGKRP